MIDKIWNGLRYHIVSEEIVCNADKEGSSVFEFTIKGPEETEKFRVLSHDEKLAYQAALKNHTEYCSYCEGVDCYCRYDDKIED